MHIYIATPLNLWETNIIIEVIAESCLIGVFISYDTHNGQYLKSLSHRINQKVHDIIWITQISLQLHS